MQSQITFPDINSNVQIPDGVANTAVVNAAFATLEANNLIVTGNTTINGNLSVNGEIVYSSLNVATFFANTANITALTVSSAVIPTITSNLTINGTLSVNGTVTLSNTLLVNGATTINAAANIIGILTAADLGTWTANGITASNGSFSKMLVGNPTGGWQGPGTLNAQGLFVNGIAVGTAATFIYTKYLYSATASQTTFSANYTIQSNVAYVDVWRNGVKLANTEYTANTGTNVILNTGATANDTVEIISWQTVSLTTPNYTNPVTFADGGVWNANGISNTHVANIPGRNLLINADFRIDQRNAGASVLIASGVTYVQDRWAFSHSQASKLTSGQNYSGVTPVGNMSANYQGVKCTTAATIGTSDFFGLSQVIELLNVQHLGFGAAGAKNISLSFLVYSSLTGTFGGAIQNYQQTRSYPFTYNIPVANTWTQIKIQNIPGDTTGTWGSMFVNFDLGTGSTYAATSGIWSAGNFVTATGTLQQVAANLNATWGITDVQLEAGSVCTDFERRDYSEELRRCQRYCRVITGNGSVEVLGIWGIAVNSSSVVMRHLYGGPMRAAASVLVSGNTYGVYDSGGIATTASGLPTNGDNSTDVLSVVPTVSGVTPGIVSLYLNTGAKLIMSAEL